MVAGPLAVPFLQSHYISELVSSNCISEIIRNDIRESLTAAKKKSYKNISILISKIEEIPD